MKKIRLPLYSNQAMSLVYHFIKWMNSTFNLFEVGSRSRYALICSGSDFDGQVTIIDRTYTDGVFEITSTFNVLLNSMHPGTFTALSIADLFEEYIKQVGIDMIIRRSFELDKVILSESDIEGFSIWAKSGDLSKLSKEFIGEQYDPFKAEMIRALIYEAIDKVKGIGPSSDEAKYLEQVRLAKKESFTQICRLTGRDAARFCNLLEDPYLAFNLAK